MYVDITQTEILSQDDLVSIVKNDPRASFHGFELGHHPVITSNDESGDKSWIKSGQTYTHPTKAVHTTVTTFACENNSWSKSNYTASIYDGDINTVVVDEEHNRLLRRNTWGRKC